MTNRIYRTVPSFQGWPYVRQTRESRFPRRTTR